MKDRDNNSTCVIILGMHRSGTSCLAGSLKQSGLYLGNVSEQNPFNLKGNQEKKDINLLNNELLKFNRGSWDNPPSRIQWNKKLIKKRDIIIKEFVSQSKKFWGFKDARTLITLPFWLEGLDKVKLVGIFRHPYLVAKSLNTRNNVFLKNGLILWYKYNLKLLSYLKDFDFPVISFDVSQQEYELSIGRICKYLGLSIPKRNYTPFFNNSMRNHVIVDNNIAISDEIIQKYEMLNQIYFNQCNV